MTHPPLPPLPIDAFLERIVALVRSGRDVILEAPPGSGKTTRVPSALAAANLPGGGKVVVLEPRRVATRLAARRVAWERGETVGESVGYRIRFERQEGGGTRLLFVTEGLLTRQLLDDPDLRGVSVVVFDEFHERSIHADLALGLVREVQEALRPDLRLVVMSATIDGAGLADALGAESVRADGRAFPVELEFAERRDDRRVAARAAAAIRKEVDRSGGTLREDLLVFLPGVGEIRELQRELGEIPAHCGFDYRPLHGELSAEQQDVAVNRGSRPRVVGATNVAETSITLDGIGVVIDSGLARVLRIDPRTGVDQLVLERITKASAEQRAGRAGRQGPGRCVRLYTEGEFREFHDAIEPEVLRVDLSAPLLTLKSWGLRDPEAFAWLTPPPAATVAGGTRLLALLGATDDADGSITPLGRELAAIPAHPRVARILVEASRLGCGVDGALLAALSQSRPLLRGRERTAASRSDLLVLRDLFHEVELARFDRRVAERLGVDVGAARAVDRERRQLERFIRPGDASDDDDRLLRCIAAGFPDRVVRRRGREGDEGKMVGGGGVLLDAQSSVCDAEYFVAVQLTRLDGNRPSRARLASEVRVEWLEEMYPRHMVDEVRAVWNDDRRRVEGWRVRAYLDLVVQESKGGNVDPEVATSILQKRATHPRYLDELRRGPLEKTLLRIECLARTRPDLGVGDVTDDDLIEIVREACVGKLGLDEVTSNLVQSHLLTRVSLGLRRGLDQLVPERWTLPSGRAAEITYRRGQPPLISAKLQEFFGLARSPRIVDGSLAVAVDLLAPNGRSVQITQDLASFWKDLYPRERRELARRYPRHPWPEDPTTATATHRPLPRRRGP